VDHPVRERGRHRTHERAILDAVARADDARACREDVVAQAAVEDERVKGLLHVGDGRVQLVDEEQVRLAPQDRARRAELGRRAAAFDRPDARHADEVLGRDLRPEEGDARETERERRVAHDRALADTRRPPDEGRSLRRQREEEAVKLLRIEREHDLGSGGIPHHE
jgi:hypothetical protein